jgi:hypothetical protein
MHPVGFILPRPSVVCRLNSSACINASKLYGVNYATNVQADNQLKNRATVLTEMKIRGPTAELWTLAAKRRYELPLTFANFHKLKPLGSRRCRIAMCCGNVCGAVL